MSCYCKSLSHQCATYERPSHGRGAPQVRIEVKSCESERSSNAGHHAAGKLQSFRPERRRGMHQIHDFTDRLDILLELRIFYYQRWRDLEHHEIVAADLTEYSM